MNLFIQNYIDSSLPRASYEYDQETKSWCAWIETLPGVYAQANTVEEVRNQLAEVIEDYLLVSLYNKHLIPELEKFARPLPYGTQADQ